MSNSKKINSLLNTLQNYYFHSFYKDLKHFQRSLVFGTLIIFLRQILIFFLLFRQTLGLKVSQGDHNLSHISQFNLNFSEELNFKLIIITSAFIILYISLSISCIIRFKFGFGFYQLGILFSFISLCWNYILVIPLSAINAGSLNTLSILNIIFILNISKIKFTSLDAANYQIKKESIHLFLSLIICFIQLGFMIRIHDQDYSTYSKDFLQKHTSVLKEAIFTVLEISCIIIQVQVENETIILLSNLQLSLLRLIDAIKNKSYFNIKVAFIEFFLTLFHCLTVLSLLINMLNLNILSVSTLILLMIPISWKITQYYCDSFYNISNMIELKNNQKQQVQISPSSFDFQLRIFWSQIRIPYEHYKRKESSLVYHEILCSHISTCLKPDEDCFLCSKIKSVIIFNILYYQQLLTLFKRNSIDMITSYVERKNLAQSYIIYTYRTYIEEALINRQLKSISFLFFSYIFFLVEVEKCKALIFYEMARFNTQLQLSAREKSFLNYIYEQITSLFCYEAQKPKQNMNQTSKKEEKFKAQVDDKNILIGITFDESINKIEQEYYEVLQKRENFLNMLCSNKIDLIKLKALSSIIIKDKEILQVKLKELALVNQFNAKLDFFMENFTFNFGFGKSKKNLFLGEYEKSKGNEKNIKEIIQSKIDLSIFKKDNCVIFITLLNDKGVIKRVQNQIQNILGYSHKEILNKNISIIIPKIIAKFHNNALSSFILKGSSLNEKTQTQEVEQITNNNFQLLLAVNSDSWAVPVSLQFRSQNLGLEDFGVCGLIKLVNKENMYVMTSSMSFHVQTMTENMYDKIFNTIVQKEKIQKIYFNRIIPLLNYLEKQCINDKFKKQTDLIKTVGFLPKENTVGLNLSLNKISKNFGHPLYQKVENLKLQKEINKLSIESYDMYSIKLKFHYHSNIYNQFNIIEIQSFKQVTQPMSQRENLFILKNQLKTLLNISYDISKDLKILEKIDNISFSQSEISLEESEVSINKSNDFISQKQEEHNLKEQFHPHSLKQSIFHEESQQFDLDIGNTSLSDYNRKQNSRGKKKGFQMKASKFQLYSENNINHHEHFAKDLHFNTCHTEKILTDQNQFSEREDFNSQQIFLQNNNLPDTPLNSFTQQITDSQRINILDPLLLSKKSDQNNNKHSKASIEQQLDSPVLFNKQHYEQQQQQNKFFENEESSEINYNFPTFQTNPHNIDTRDNTTTALTVQDFFHQENNSPIAEKPQPKGSIFKLLKEKLKDLKIQKKNNIKNKDDNHNKSSKEISTNEKQICNIDSQKRKSIHSFDTIMQFNTQQSIKTEIKERIMRYQTSMKSKQDQFSSQYQGSRDSANLSQCQKSQKQIFKKNQQQLEVEKQEEELKLRMIELIEDDCNQEQENQAQDSQNKDSENNDSSLNEIAQQQRMQASSVKSGQTSRFEHKISVRKSIIQSKRDSSLYILKYFGQLSIIAITILTIVEYILIQDLFKEAEVHRQNIPWPNRLRVNYIYPQIYMVLKRMIKENAFEDNSLYQQELIDELDSKSLHDLNESLKQLSDFQRQGLEGKEYFQYINTQVVPFFLHQDDNTIPQQEWIVSNDKYQRTVNVILLRQIYFMIANSYQNYYRQGTSTQFQKQLIDNFNTFSSNLTYTQAQVQLKTKSVLSNIVFNSYLQLYLEMSVSAFLVIILFPLYYFVQYKNQNVLSLFGTLSPFSLSQMIKILQLGLYSYSMNKNKSKIMKGKSESGRKLKNLSETTKIPKYSILLIAAGIASISIILIQPLVTVILFTDFNNEAQVDVDLLGTLYSVIAQEASTVIVSFQYMASLLIIDSKIYNPSYYFNRLSSILTSNPILLSNVSLVVEKSQKQVKKQQSLYENFLYLMLNQNVCLALQNYPQYVIQESTLDINTCFKTSSGILNSGFQISLQKFFQKFVGLYEIFSNESVDQPKELRKWQKETNILDFYRFSQFLIQSITSQKYFLLQVMNEDQNRINTIQFILVIFQCTLLIVAFSFGWNWFCKYIQEEMFLIRQTLTLINIEQLIENPYILSFLTK